jgi:hypothetical protein
MSQLPLGIGSYWREVGKLPQFRLRNMFVEKDPTNTIDGLVRLQRPKTVPFVTLAAAPVLKVWQQAGALNGDFLVACNERLWRVTTTGVATDLGDIGPGTPSIAARQEDTLICCDGLLYLLLADNTMTPIELPEDVAAFDCVATIDDYYIMSVADSRRFYWIQPAEVTIDPLDFAEAERRSDNIKAVVILADEIWFLKETNEEVWQSTGDSTAPFQRFAARATTFGCASRDSVVSLYDTIMWVTKNNEVAVAQGMPKLVSNAGVAEHIRLGHANIKAWGYALDQHRFYVLTTDTATLVFDLLGESDQWSEWSSYNQPNWLAYCGAQDGAMIVAGSSATGDLWTLAPEDVPLDAGDARVIHEITGGLEISGVGVSCDSVSARVAVGEMYSYEDTDNLLELSWSDDEGRTWSNYRSTSLGEKGHYAKDIVFRSLGFMQRPGRLFKFRTSAAAVVRFTHAHVNEA